MPLQQLIIAFIANGRNRLLGKLGRTTTNILIIHEISSGSDIDCCLSSVFDNDHIRGVVPFAITLYQHTDLCRQPTRDTLLLYILHRSDEFSILRQTAILECGRAPMT